MPKQLTVINLDWFQVNAFPDPEKTAGFSSLFEVKRLPYGTRHFSKIEEVFKKGKRICTVASMPYSPVIDKRTHLIKFDNYILYHEKVFEYVERFLKMNAFILHGISRLDVCCDFQYFKTNVKPETFIKNYCSEVFLKVGKSKFAIRGSQSLHNTFEYIRFGTVNSEISYYMYNKTKELREVKEKPHIRDAWKKNGLTEANKDVWRLEFTIKSAAAKEIVNEKEVNETTGEINEGSTLNMKNLSIIKRENLQTLFLHMVEKYFQFVKNDGLKNKSRMKRLRLFDNVEAGTIMFDITGKKESSRSDKIFIKKMYSLNDELRGTDFELGIAANEILYNYINERQLEPWAMRKGLMPAGRFK